MKGYWYDGVSWRALPQEHYLDGKPRPMVHMTDGELWGRQFHIASGERAILYFRGDKLPDPIGLKVCIASAGGGS